MKQTNQLFNDIFKIKFYVFLVFLIAGLFSLFWETAILYGILVGILGFFIQTFSFYLISKISYLEHPVIFSWVKWLIDVGIAISLFCLIIFGFNEWFSVTTIKIEQTLYPVNSFSYLISYIVSTYSIFLLVYIKKKE